MKLNLKYVVLFTLLFCADSVFSQIIFSGKVTDTENRALPNVNVLIQGALDSKIYAFSSSDKTGGFSIKYEGDKSNKNLVFKLLGFENKIVSLANISAPLKIQLTVSNHVLQEVVIKSKPIVQKGDTTEYLLSAFSDGTEQKIEEVLKKLPGISVDDNGNISYKGKSIEKITLDDADLFDKNYKLASKNIPANYIGKVQAIENYHENKLLRSAEESDKVILNLSFKEDVKMLKPFGQASLGGGIAEKYALDNNLFSMTKKLKLYDILSFNNSEISASFSSMENQRVMYQAFDNYSDAHVISDLSEYTSPEFKHTETKRLFNSLNFVYQPAKKLQVTGNLIYNHNKNTSSGSQITDYFTDSLIITKTSMYLNKPKTLFGLLKVKYDLAENKQLEYQGKADWDNQTITNQLFDAENFLHRTRGKVKFMLNDVNLTIANKDSSAFIFNISSRNNQNAQQFDYLRIENNEQKINQFLQATNAQYTISAKYMNKNSSQFSYSLQPVFSFNEQKINSDISAKNDTTFENADLRDISLIFNMEMTYRFWKSSLSLHSGIGYSKQFINQQDKFRFEFSPQITYQLALGDHSISLSADYSKGKYDLLKYVGYYSDYRDKNEKTSVYTYGSTFSWGGMYNYFSTFNQTFLLVMYNNSINYNDFTAIVELSPEMNHYYSIAGQSTKSQSLFLNFKKYFDPIRHNFQIDNFLYYQKYNNYVNNDLRKIQSYSNNLRFSIKSIFDIPFEYTLGVKLNYYTYKTNVSALISTLNYSYFQYFVYKPTKKIKIKLQLDEYFLGKNKDFYCLIRPNISYIIKKDKLSVDLSAYNILNYKEIRNYYISDYYSVENNSSVKSAQYLLSARFQY